MYPASDWSVVLRAIMDISARAFSLADRPRSGHPGHQCSHALGRPILHFVLSSRRPRLETVDRVTSSLAPRIAQFLCSSQGPFLRPGPQNVDRVARRGGQGRPSRWLAAGSGVARPRLDRAEHGARIKPVGRLQRRSSSARPTFVSCPGISLPRQRGRSLSPRSNIPWSGLPGLRFGQTRPSRALKSPSWESSLLCASQYFPSAQILLR
jgi:hypothetical protein